MGTAPDPKTQFHWRTVRDVNIVCKGDASAWKAEYRLLFASEPPERLYEVNSSDMFTLLRMLIRRRNHREASDGS